MAKNPADRIQSAAEVAELLERCLAHLQQPSLVPPPFEVPAPPVRRTRTNRRRWALAAALLVIGFSCLGLAEATGVTQITAAILRLAIGEGTLAVEVDDPALRVRIDGQEVSLGRTGIHEFRTRAGQHRVDVIKDGATIHHELVHITRGLRTPVRIELRRAAMRQIAERVAR